MKKFLGKLVTAVGIAAFTLGFAATAANAHDTRTHLVIQVSSADPLIQKIALNNAVNVQKAIPGAVVEIVAYGPGLGLLTMKSKQKDRVASLALNEGLTFSACGNTMKKAAKKSGKMPVLINGVKVVQAGVLRIMELQAQGYTYIRP